MSTTRAFYRLLARVALALVALHFCTPTFAAEPESTTAEKTSSPWDFKKLSESPKIFEAPQVEGAGVRGIFYEGPAYKGKPTKVFAWYGVPADTKGKKVPAVVLVHGGGGSAFIHWVKMWNERGYAAIAMDTCGCLPGSDKGGGVTRPRHADGGPPGWGGFDQIDEPVEDQWTYHAVADVILAHSLIRSFAEVDADRTALTGISWGGYLTCIVSGIDSRFVCAVPVYGCGYLGENSAWLPNFEKMEKEKADKWLKLWDPSVYVKNAKMPLLWCDGTNDFAYPLDSLQKTYRLPSAERTLSIGVRMAHSHEAGQKPVSIHAYIDSFLNGGKPLIKITEQGVTANDHWAKFQSATPVEKAEFNYTVESSKWQSRKWETVPAKLDGNKAIGEIPADATVFYLNIFDNRGTFVSTQHVEVEAPKP